MRKKSTTEFQCAQFLAVSFKILSILMSNSAK